MTATVAGAVGRLHRVPRWALLPFALALVVRVVVVVAQLELDLFQVSFDASDSDLYRELAGELLHHGRYHADGEPTAYVTPLYPMLLAALFVVSESTMWIALVQCVLGALTVVAVADVTRRIATPRAAMAAGLAAAVYPHLVFWTGYVLTETLYVLLVVVAFDVLVVAIERRTARWAAAAGAIAGLAALARPIALGFAALVIVGVLVARHPRCALAAAGGLAAVIAPWAVRNLVVLDSPIVTSSESGFVLWQGNSPGVTGGSGGYVDPPDFQYLELPPGLSEVEVDERYGSAAREWMLEHPGEVARLVPEKWANMLRPTYAGASSLNTAVTLATYPLAVVLGLVGLVVAWRRGLAGRLLVLLVAYHLLVHGIITGMIRFRLPLEAVLLVAVGIAVDELLRRRTAVR